MAARGDGPSGVGRRYRGGGGTIAARCTLIRRPAAALSRLAGQGRSLPVLARNGGLGFFVATLVYNSGNFFYHMAMSRMLGPDRYGALGSLLGLVTVAVLPVSALQAAITQSVAARHASARLSAGSAQGAAWTGSAPPARQQADPNDFPSDSGSEPMALGRPFLWTCLAAGGLIGALVAAAPFVDGFVSMNSPVPLLMLGAYVATTIGTIVPQGVLIGQLRFRPVAASLVAGSVVRLVAGVTLVGAGLGLDAASAASALSGIVSLAIVVWPLRFDLGRASLGRLPRQDRSSSHPWLAAREGEADPIARVQLHIGPAVLAVVALSGVSAFLGIDSLLARHYLSRLDAGYYVAAATAARIALFLPGAVAMTVFPRLAAAQGDHRVVRRLLLDALGLTILLSGGAALVIAAFPHLVIAVLFGNAYQAASGPLAILAAAAAAMGIASVLVYFFLAQRSLVATGCWGAVALATVLIVVVHDGLDTIAWLTLAVTGSMTLVMATMAFSRRHPATSQHRHRSSQVVTRRIAPDLGLADGALGGTSTAELTMLTLADHADDTV